MIIHREGRVFELQLKLDKLKSLRAMLAHQVIADNLGISQKHCPVEIAEMPVHEFLEHLPSSFVDRVKALYTVFLPVVETLLNQINLYGERDIEGQLTSQGAVRGRCLVIMNHWYQDAYL